MTTAIQRRRGTGAQHSSFTGLLAEITVDTTDNRLVVHDGVTPGGHPVAKESEVTGFAPLASPTFTGTPAAPTAAAATNTTQIATTAFVRTELANLVASSPAALDTLDELAAALGDDANFATTVTNNLAAKAPVASPALTGNPTAPTQSTSDDSTKIATTAFVHDVVDGASVTSVYPRGHLFGFRLSNNATDATNDVDVQPGQCSDSTGAANIDLTAALTKRLDAAWAVGSGNGGLDQGTIANATYHVHAIKRVDTDVEDAIFSLSHDRRMTATMTIASPGVVTAGVTGDGHGLVAGSPFKFETTGVLPTGVTAGTQYYVIATGLTETTFQFSASNGGAAVNTTGSQSGVHTLVPGPQLPTNYTLFRRVGSIMRSGGSILAFKQFGDEFLLASAVIDVNADNPGTSAVTRTLTVPVGVKVRAVMNLGMGAQSSSNIAVHVSSLDTSDQAPSTTLAPLSMTPYRGAVDATMLGRVEVLTNNSAQVRSRISVSVAGDRLSIVTLGWVDRRGREY